MDTDTETWQAARILVLEDALRRIKRMDGDFWGKQGIFTAQRIAQRALEDIASSVDADRGIRTDDSPALRAAYENGRASVLAAITTIGPNGEVFNAYNGGEDLREFLL